MIKSFSHIALATMVSMTPPGASMIEYSCDLSESPTQIVSTLAAGNHVDYCCDEEASCAPALAADDCCRAIVFSLPPTSPAPAPVLADVPTAVVVLDIPSPDACTRLAIARGPGPLRFSPSRNLPLLI